MSDDLAVLKERHEKALLELDVQKAEQQLFNSKRSQCLDVLESWYYDASNYVNVADYLPGSYGGMGMGTAYPDRKSDREYGRNFPFFRTEIELMQIRGAAKILATGNENAVGVLNHLTNYIIGEGFTINTAARKNRKPPKGLVEKIQECLDKFLDRNRWTGNLDRELFLRARRDGERFLGLWHRGNGNVDARTVEPVQVTAPGNTRQIEEWLGATEGPYDWMFGIMADDADSQNEHGYYVQWQDDSDTDWDFLPGGSDPIFPPLGADAQNLNCWMDHDKLNVDRVIKRGLSDFFCGQATLELARKLLRNVGEGASLQAAIAWIREVASGTTGEQLAAGRTLRADATYNSQGPSGNDRTHYVQQYDPGTVLTVNGAQYKPGPMGSERNTGLLLAHTTLLRNFSVRWGMPEHLVTGSAENNNYASILEAGSPFRKACEAAQIHEKQAHSRILWRVVWFAWKAELFGSISWAELRYNIEIQIEPTAVEVRDADKETTRYATMYEAGCMSRTTWQLKEGLDPEQEKANIEKEGGPPNQQQGLTGPLANAARVAGVAPKDNDQNDPTDFSDRETLHSVLESLTDILDDSVTTDEDVIEGSWDESKHPRNHGKFSHTQGAGATVKAKKKRALKKTTKHIVKKVVKKTSVKGKPSAKKVSGEGMIKLADLKKEDAAVKALTDKDYFSPEAQAAQKAHMARVAQYQAQQKYGTADPKVIEAKQNAEWQANLEKLQPFKEAVAIADKFVKDKATASGFAKNLKDLRTNHVEEAQQLEAYQGSSAYATLNEALRAGKPLKDEKYQKLAADLNQAISRAGDFPKPVTTYRGATLSTEHLNSMMAGLQESQKTGKPFVDRGFVSQSIDKDWADQFAKGFAGSTDADHHPVLFTMAAKRGLYANTHQAEIIQSPGTKYKVKSIKPGKVTNIELEEV